MKVNCWDKCFLCLTNLESTSSSSSSCGGKRSRGRPKQLKIKVKPNLSVLIKYLLGDKNDSLLQRIRRLQQANSSSSSSSEGLIKFCDKCQDSARRISHLQMELEVIQMKIVDILRSVRETVVNNSNGIDATSGLSLEEFTEERQEVLDTLYAFQAAVVEKSKESIHVPLVYIKKFTGRKNMKPDRATATVTGEEDKFNLIKTEEPDAHPFEEILSNLGDDYDSFDYDDPHHHPATPNVQFNEGVEVEDDDRQEEEEMDTKDNVRTPPPGHSKSVAPLAQPTPPPPQPRKLQKRGRPRKNILAPSSEPDVKNPIIKEENFADGTRKARSVAQTAVKRIPEVKKLPRKKKVLKGKSPRSGYKKIFVCKLCSYKTLRTFKFEHHLTQHESPEVVNHICPHCSNPPRQFSEKQSFDYHMDSHSGLNKITCDICATLIDPNVILEHLRGHPEAEKIFECCCCSYRCGTREAYLNHTQYHGMAALVCDVCSKKFDGRQKMLEHLHKEHKLLQKIKCDVENCGKEFWEKTRLQAHKKMHSETFFCSECNLQLRSARYLLDHQAREHSMKKPRRCSECPETFADKQTLLSHLIKVHGAAKLKCPHCPKEFSNRGSLNSHVNLHEGISFPCDQCGKAFGHRAALKAHQGVHNTTEDFVCEECGKAFRHELLLRAHIKIHIGDKKHKCRFCQKGFVDRRHLICHERIHTGEKPYVCEACGKDFNQRSGLSLHRKTRHKELIASKNNSFY